jgi:pimeloyl-ACP methyl ester carboxylesterase
VLVHGLLAGPSMLRPMRGALRRLGHDAHLVPELGALVRDDIRRHAEELETGVQRVLRTTGARTIDVVGTSQGGLVALWWAHRTGWRAVGRLVAVGTPFRGAPLARRVRWLRVLSAGLGQIQPGGPFLEALAAVPLERPVTAISMANDPVCPPRVCALPGMEHVTLAGGVGPVAHQSMMLQPRVARAIHRALSC